MSVERKPCLTKIARVDDYQVKLNWVADRCAEAARLANPVLLSGSEGSPRRGRNSPKRSFAAAQDDTGSRSHFKYPAIKGRGMETGRLRE